MKNELMGLLDTYIDHDENCTMLGKSPVCHCDHTRYVAEAHAKIEALYAARFERALGENSHTHDGAAGDEATWEAAQNQLGAEARTRYYQGDGNGQD